MEINYFGEMLESMEMNANSMLANGEFEGDAYSALHRRFFSLIQDLWFYLGEMLSSFDTNTDLTAFLLRNGYCTKSEIKDFWGASILKIQVHVQEKFIQALDEKYDGIMS